MQLCVSEQKNLNGTIKFFTIKSYIFHATHRKRKPILKFLYYITMLLPCIADVPEFTRRHVILQKCPKGQEC